MNAFPQPSLLGKGWNFPVKPSAETSGVVAKVSGDDDIHQSIWLIIATAPGERVMRPDFGCGIHALIFAPGSPETLGRARTAIVEALNRFEPRITSVEASVRLDEHDSSILSVAVSYLVRATNSSQNLVFPFYLGVGA